MAKRRKQSVMSDAIPHIPLRDFTTPVNCGDYPAPMHRGYYRPATPPVLLPPRVTIRNGKVMVVTPGDWTHLLECTYSGVALDTPVPCIELALSHKQAKNVYRRCQAADYASAPYYPGHALIRLWRDCPDVHTELRVPFSAIEQGFGTAPGTLAREERRPKQRK